MTLSDRSRLEPDPQMVELLETIRSILHEDEMDTHSQTDNAAAEPLVLDASMRVADLPDVSGQKTSGLLGKSARASMDRALDNLHSALEQKDEPRHTVSAETRVGSGNSPTIEDIVRDEVRNMVGVWLDANLPPMVEAMVRAEISRMSRR